MSEHVHDCDRCSGYTVCSEETCKVDQQASCWNCLREKLEGAHKAKRKAEKLELEALALLDEAVSLLREAHNELNTIEAITVSPSDTDGLLDLVRRMAAFLEKNK